jgi:hypothetical protein
MLDTLEYPPQRTGLVLSRQGLPGRRVGERGQRVVLLGWLLGILMQGTRWL